MIAQLMIWVIGILVSGTIGFLLSKGQSSRDVVKNTLLSALIGTGFLTIMQLQYELSSFRGLRYKVAKPNVLEEVSGVIENSSRSTPMLSSIRFRRDSLEDELQGLLEGNISLKDEEEVIREWARMFGEAGTAVAATNYVSPDFWVQGSEFSSKQLSVQRKATENGVKVRRIFIYEESPETDKLGGLALEQKDIGIDVRSVRREDIEAMQSYNKYVPALGGTIDFVIFDLNTVLLTYVDERREISLGELSKERVKVDNARDFFEKVWRISEPME